MRTGSSEIVFRGHRNQRRLDSKQRNSRRLREYRFDVEGLESRTLLATIPGPVATSTPLANLSLTMDNGPGAQEDSPVVAVDPLDPEKVISVWVNNDTADIAAPTPQVFLEGEYSVNNGQTWTAFNSVSFVLPDPNTTNPTVPYLQVTNPSVSFDRNGNFYVLADQHNSGGTSGALVLQKYSFTGDAPVAARLRQPSGGSSTYSIVYQWLPSGDLAYEPTLAVDDNLASFTDPTTGQVQTDSSAGNVYVAWASGSVAPDSVLTLAAPFGTAFFNGNVIKMVTSTDGGQDFTAPIVMTQNCAKSIAACLVRPKH